MSKTTNQTAKKWALGALFAGLFGYLAGILTAPKSGKETRQDIKNAAEQSIAEAEKQLKKLHTQMAELITQAKQKLSDLKGSAQKDMQLAIEKAVTVKEKAREVLSAVHEGDAEDEDKELKTAIKDATEAIDHLKAFLSK